ncbi:hypothetical protein DL765_003856 [Monosporascus sp. GIB2]|nr:hypothetical protein DL765_003856 [Monosporascus sp. GIB2]
MAGPAIPANQSLVDVPRIVKGVIDTIGRDGDAAVGQHSEKFDNWSPELFKLSEAEIEHAVSQVPTHIIQDIKDVQANVRRFAIAHKQSLRGFEIETAPGLFLGQRNNPVSAVGAYIPRGRYPLLASAHMAILTAEMAGVKTAVACTPPARGNIPNTTVAAMHFAGVDEIFILGGVQAVAAIAVGTENVPKVDFIAARGTPLSPRQSASSMAKSASTSLPVRRRS